MANISDYFYKTLMDFKLQMKTEIHTCMPGVVVAVNGDRVDVQPLIKSVDIGTTRKIRTETGEYVTIDDNDYPVVMDCPLQMLVTSKARITIPIEVGDQGLLLVSERDIRNWKEQKGNTQASTRKFNRNDAFFLPFINASISNYDATCIDIEYQSTKLKVKSTGVEITGNVKITGTLETTGDATIAGKSFEHHTHLYTPGTLPPTQTGQVS